MIKAVSAWARRVGANLRDAAGVACGPRSYVIAARYLGIRYNICTEILRTAPRRRGRKVEKVQDGETGNGGRKGREGKKKQKGTSCVSSHPNPRQDGTNHLITNTYNENILRASPAELDIARREQFAILSGSAALNSSRPLHRMPEVAPISFQPVSTPISASWDHSPASQHRGRCRAWRSLVLHFLCFLFSFLSSKSPRGERGARHQIHGESVDVR